MNSADLTALLDRNRVEPQTIGEYLSSVSNSACLLGKPRGYLVFDMEDGTPASTMGCGLCSLS